MESGSGQTDYSLITQKLNTQLPALKIADNKIERKTVIKLLGAMLDENISWEEHVHTNETKPAENIGQLYRAKPLLEEKSIKSIYLHIFMHT